MKRKFKLHFVGIGGIGMSGIAEVFLSQGHEVSGSDLSSHETTERLVRMGALIKLGHARENVGEVDVVVISSAVKTDNPEVLEAKRKGIPIIPRAEMLAEIMRGKTAIAVAGTHGKTTTTSMAAQILIQADLKPTVVVGGKVEAIGGSNAKVGSGDIVIAEADESDGSFHLLPATHAIITNIDEDHMEYYRTREKLLDAFLDFTKKIPFYGCVFLCGDDRGVKDILDEITRPHSTYGFDERNDIFAKNIRILGENLQKFELWVRPHRMQKHEFLGEIELGVLGKHNLLNALGAIGVALSQECPITAIQEALKNFTHVKRRFEEKFVSTHSGIRLIDDYGHHPTEIRAVLATARLTDAKRIITLFQPHRYTRTKLCWNEFLNCFQDTDELILLPVYSAGEEAIPGVHSKALAQAIEAETGKKVHYFESFEVAEDYVFHHLKPCDLILTLGAGSVTKLAANLAERFHQNES